MWHIMVNYGDFRVIIIKLFKRVWSFVNNSAKWKKNLLLRVDNKSVRGRLFAGAIYLKVPWHFNDVRLATQFTMN